MATAAVKQGRVPDDHVPHVDQLRKSMSLFVHYLLGPLYRLHELLQNRVTYNITISLPYFITTILSPQVLSATTLSPQQYYHHKYYRHTIFCHNFIFPQYYLSNSRVESITISINSTQASKSNPYNSCIDNTHLHHNTTTTTLSPQRYHHTIITTTLSPNHYHHNTITATSIFQQQSRIKKQGHPVRAIFQYLEQVKKTLR